MGIGIEKSMFKIKNVFDMGGGLFITKPVQSFFNKQGLVDVKDLNIGVGITGVWKF